VLDPGRTVLDGGTAVLDPGRTVLDPGTTVIRLGTTPLDPGLGLRRPRFRSPAPAWTSTTPFHTTSTS
jgi:hypothetical protein